MTTQGPARCVVLLSEKSSGSSAFQRVVTGAADIRHAARTRHFEFETLYWTKAASVLGLPQREMIDSEVPIPADHARADLVHLLTDNLDSFHLSGDDRQWIMEGWRALCRQHAPVFFEKSPHHLLQWSALELLIECADQSDDIEFLFVGLVRNPMDTIYSQYMRWATPPKALEEQWCAAYRNLLRLRSQTADRFELVRYEDMVSSPEVMEPVFRFCGVPGLSNADQLHSREVQKWRDDRWFGHTLAPESLDLAKAFGYSAQEMTNTAGPLWPAVQRARRARHKAKQTAKRLVRSWRR